MDGGEDILYVETKNFILWTALDHQRRGEGILYKSHKCSGSFHSDTEWCWQRCQRAPPGEWSSCTSLLSLNNSPNWWFQAALWHRGSALHCLQWNLLVWHYRIFHCRDKYTNCFVSPRSWGEHGPDWRNGWRSSFVKEIIQGYILIGAENDGVLLVDVVGASSFHFQLIYGNQSIE